MVPLVPLWIVYFSSYADFGWSIIIQWDEHFDVTWEQIRGDPNLVLRKSHRKDLRGWEEHSQSKRTGADNLMPWRSRAGWKDGWVHEMLRTGQRLEQSHRGSLERPEMDEWVLLTQSKESDRNPLGEHGRGSELMMLALWGRLGCVGKMKFWDGEWCCFSEA
jgi:hypothetical protein